MKISIKRRRDRANLDSGGEIIIRLVRRKLTLGRGISKAFLRKDYKTALKWYTTQKTVPTAHSTATKVKLITDNVIVL